MKFNFKFLQDIFNDISLRTKLLLAYFFLVALPLILFTSYSFIRMSTVIQQEAFLVAQKTFDDSYLSLCRSLENAESVIEILTYDPLVYQMISNDPADYELIKQLEDTNQLKETFLHLKKMSGVDNIILYTGSDFLYSQQNREIFSLSDQEDNSWPKQMISSDISQRWFYPSLNDSEEDVFSVMRVIYNPVEISPPLGVLRVDIKSQVLSTLLNQSFITKNSQLLMVHQEDVLLSSDRNADGEIGEIKDLFPLLLDKEEDTWIHTNVANTNSYILFKSIPSTNWVLVSIIPYNDIFHVTLNLRSEMILVVIILACLAYTLAYLVSDSSLKRLSDLLKVMQDVKSGNINAIIIPKGKDEIGELMYGFSVMMDRIKLLMDEKISDGREIKSLELKALQAQINPHFLYNSLDLINCVAIKNKVPEISRLVNALAKFYKLSLNCGRETITLKEELEHIKLYIQIQNMRFENRINVIWDIDDDILSFMVVKIILQPIVENSIIHGIFERPDKTGTIIISAKMLSEDIFITIKDNGVGMSSEVLNTNFNNSKDCQDFRTKGYGVHNINERLHLAYGYKYGLSCTSTPGQGTTVSIYIPAMNPSL